MTRCGISWPGAVTSWSTAGYLATSDLATTIGSENTSMHHSRGHEQMTSCFRTCLKPHSDGRTSKVTLPEQEIFRHVTLLKTKTCRFHTSVFVWLKHANMLPAM